jgi:hypothetical protein
MKTKFCLALYSEWQGSLCAMCAPRQYSPEESPEARLGPRRRLLGRAQENAGEGGLPAATLPAKGEDKALG